MEYIRISDSKLKIICESNDLSAYGICADSLEYGNAQTRSFLEEILEQAKYKLGFETKRHRILVQVYPSLDGGCEIFVNRLESLKSDEDESKAADESPKKAPRIDEKLFFFDSLDPLLEVCKRLYAKGFEKRSSAFFLENEGYFLRLELEGELDEYQIPDLSEYSFILEFGEAENVSKRIPYLKEYGRCICRSGAVETLGQI